MSTPQSIAGGSAHAPHERPQKPCIQSWPHCPHAACWAQLVGELGGGTSAEQSAGARGGAGAFLTAAGGGGGGGGDPHRPHTRLQWPRIHSSPHLPRSDCAAQEREDPGGGTSASHPVQSVLKELKGVTGCGGAGVSAGTGGGGAGGSVAAGVSAGVAGVSGGGGSAATTGGGRRGRLKGDGHRGGRAADKGQGGGRGRRAVAVAVDDALWSVGVGVG